MRWTSWLAVGLCIVGCSSEPIADPDAGAPDAGAPADLGVYSEFLSYAEVEPHLDALARHHTRLSIAVPDEEIGDAALASLLRAAARRGVEVRIWLLLARSAGYWPNEENVTELGAAVDRLLSWLEVEQLRASAIVFDLEPGLAYSEELTAAFAAGSITTLTPLLEAHRDPVAFEAARAAFDQIVARIHARGLRAQCVTYPQVLDDLGDGDADIQDALDIPVDGIAWDEVAFMVYQTAFAQAASNQWLGAGLIGLYAEDAREHFGDRAVIALGLVGRVGIIPPTGPVYEQAALLREDAAAARAAGITTLEVYSLDGALMLGTIDPWLEAARTAPVAATPSTSARTARTLAAGLDLLLDR